MLDKVVHWFHPLRESLAQLTSLFDWQAIGAVGTVWALLYLARESGRAARAERERKKVLLSAVIDVLNRVWETVGPEVPVDTPMTTQDLTVLGRLEEVTNDASKRLALFDPLRLAELDLGDFVSEAQYTLANISARFAEGRRNNEAPDIWDDHDFLEKQMLALCKSRNSLRTLSEKLPNYILNIGQRVANWRSRRRGAAEEARAKKI